MGFIDLALVDGAALLVAAGVVAGIVVAVVRGIRIHLHIHDDD